VPTKLEQRQQATRERRLARYQAIIDLHEQGGKIRAIARQLGTSRSTVQRYLKAGGFPEMSKRGGQSSILTPYLPYLRQRWAEGCHNGLQLYREIQQKGYSGSRPSVSRWVAKIRKQAAPRKPANDVVPRPRETATRPWSARYAVWLLLKQPATLEPAKRAALEPMLNANPALRSAYNFAQAFLRMVRNRYPLGLRPWLDAVIENKIPELAGLAKSLRQDFNAVFAALSLPWSNGQVEGQVNRLKMIKRQMYGRAGFDLLRVRVICH
jgi:transposase